MGQVADRADFHHPRAALEGVQVAQQGFHFLAIAGSACQRSSARRSFR
jgi:hypothetical protein